MKETFYPEKTFGVLEAKPYPSSLAELERAKSLYLAGLLEAGGSFAVNYSHFKKPGSNGTERQATNIRFNLSFTDVDPKVVASLQELFGGRSKRFPSSNRSWTWLVTDSKIIDDLFDSIYPYAPSRRGQMDMFYEILNAKSTAGKLEHVDIFNRDKSSSRADVSKDEYDNLVSNPAFLAGVHDSRGHRYATHNNDFLNSVYYGSINIPLIDKIVEAHGGSNGYHQNADHLKMQDRAALQGNDCFMLLHRIEPYRAPRLYAAQTRIVGRKGHVSPVFHGSKT